MRYLRLRLLLAGLFSLSRAQLHVSGYVKDTTEGWLPFVQVRNLRTGEGTLTDWQGFFRLAAQRDDTLELRCLGYAPLRITADQLPDTLILYPQPVEIVPVVIYPTEAFVYRLIWRLITEGRRWNPLLRSHQYLSYNKLLMDTPDSSMPYGFIWETETEKTFYSPTRQRETLRSQRIAGNLPVKFFFSPTTFQPLNLYSSWLEVGEWRFASPVGEAAPDYYHFEVLDTSWQGKDTIWHIAFYPRQGREAWALKGHLSCSFPDAALIDFQGTISRAETEEAFLQITSYRFAQQMRKIGDTLWFPERFQAEIGLRAGQGEGAIPLTLRLQSHIREVRIPPTSVIPSGSELYLPPYIPTLPDSARIIPLSPTETLSYQKLDSLFRRTKVAMVWRGLFDLPLLLNGRWEWGYLRWILRPLLLYHEAEGWRPQLGLENSDKVSAFFRVRVWVGYGTYRGAGWLGTPWRWGAEAEVGARMRIRLSLYDDVRETTLPRLLDEVPSDVAGECRPYENPSRSFAFSQSQMLREKAMQLQLRLPIASGLWFWSELAHIERKTIENSWRGLVLKGDWEYAPYVAALRSGSLLWRAEPSPPRLRLQIGALYAEQLLPWIQMDFWHRWRWQHYASFSLRIGGIWSFSDLPAIWRYTLRALSPNPIGMPEALAAHPYWIQIHRAAYLFYEWSIPNTRFPSPKWTPIVAFHLQGYSGIGWLYPEAGVSVRNWMPQKAARILPGLAWIRFGVYTSLHKPGQPMFVRLMGSL
ncbi:MAG: DUF5686 and carboxypeptidase regulatory-like domain-containing protein [Bacteroidia bacterium]|nr:DUF5686 and carboxypeptidase regulatory-like domain-containing protein [Bacteroidia bacterium]MDW8235477.1 hypothetical protein [Bacteroidia bacterium]